MQNHTHPDAISVSSKKITHDASEDSDEEDLLVLQPEDHTVVRIGVIADIVSKELFGVKELTLGLLLAGVGYHRESFKNYLMVDAETPLKDLESFFHTLYRRNNIGLILVDYTTAKRISHVLDKCKQMLPVVVILPTKSSITPYLEEKERQRRQHQRENYL